MQIEAKPVHVQRDTALNQFRGLVPNQPDREMFSPARFVFI